MKIFLLAQSSNMVCDNQDEFKVMGSALITTKKLVSRFGRRETTDLILIILALAAFFAACVYVIQKRMFWRKNIVTDFLWVSLFNSEKYDEILELSIRRLCAKGTKHLSRSVTHRCD